MNSPLVSIIIPIYNSELFLDKCIQSAINQTYRNIEIILVDDGSIDSSGEICDNYTSIDPRVKTIHKINGGLVSSRKAGLRASTGDYIFYIDGDDWIELDVIKNYVDQVLKYDADIVVSSHIVNLEGREDILMNTLLPGVYNKEELRSTIYSKMLYTGKFSQFGIFSYSWGKLYRRELLLQIQLEVDESITMGEDALCLYPALLDANTLVILQQPGYHYRQRADSLIKSLKRVEISRMQKVYDNLKKAFLDRGALDMMLPQLQQYLLSLLIINTQGPNSKDATTIYPFSKIKLGQNLIIYGGGTLGQHVYKKILNHKKHNILAWIDEKHKHYSKLNLPVTGFSKIRCVDYDVILIALIDEDNSNQAYSKLLKYGVDPSKIIQIPYHTQKENIQKQLLEYKLKL